MTDHLAPQAFGEVLAIRYGDMDGNFDDGAVARIAQFVLGHDVDTRVTLLNERLTAVVQPINEFWNPKAGLADILVTDTKTGTRMALGLGQWLVKYPKGNLRPLSHNQLVAQHFPEPAPLTFRQELAQVINRHSKENGSDTPDYILAGYLEDVLRAFDLASNRRKDWSAR
jgi:hypothetical protein